MEITGKITHALEVRSGQSARTGNNWMMQTFVIETHEQYPRRCAFEVFGEDKLKDFNIQVGEELTVSFDIDAREYQGRWYNSVRAWRVERVAPGQAPMGAAAPPVMPPMPAGAPAPAPAPAPNAGAGDDLPF
ncbi:MAG: DUF3127 domain-containing protein [Bacteroidales bacterium]|nr:DUF3127 domain-containing protein [Bacteroidales bacterium]